MGIICYYQVFSDLSARAAFPLQAAIRREID
jgi:hypothetical protein